MNQKRNNEETFIPAIPRELPPTAPPRSVPLDDAAISTLHDYMEQRKGFELSLRNCDLAINAVLNYFARQKKLEGNWQLAENQRELVLVPPPENKPQ